MMTKRPRLPTLKPTLAPLPERVTTLSSTSWRSGKKTAERGYGARWQREREKYLRLNPLCVFCRRDGRVVPATVVDHKTPHRGDMDLFWDCNNWQSMCGPCHSGEKQRQENAEQRGGVG